VRLAGHFRGLWRQGAKARGEREAFQRCSLDRELAGWLQGTPQRRMAAHHQPPPGLLTGGNDTAGAGAMGGDLTEESILTLLCLGHSLPGSESPLALLSKDIMEQFIRPCVSRAYTESRASAGLLTPPAIKWRAAPRISQPLDSEVEPLPPVGVAQSVATLRPRRAVRFEARPVTDAGAAPSEAGEVEAASAEPSVFFTALEWQGRARAPPPRLQAVASAVAPHIPMPNRRAGTKAHGTFGPHNNLRAKENAFGLRPIASVSWLER